MRVPRPQPVVVEVRHGDTSSRMGIVLEHPAGCAAVDVEVVEAGGEVRLRCPACRAGASLAVQEETDFRRRGPDAGQHRKEES